MPIEVPHLTTVFEPHAASDDTLVAVMRTLGAACKSDDEKTPLEESREPTAWEGSMLSLGSDIIKGLDIARLFIRIMSHKSGMFTKRNTWKLYSVKGSGSLR